MLPKIINKNVDLQNLMKQIPQSGSNVHCIEMRPQGCTCRENPLTCKGAIEEREAATKAKTKTEK